MTRASLRSRAPRSRMGSAAALIAALALPGLAGAQQAEPAFTAQASAVARPVLGGSTTARNAAPAQNAASTPQRISAAQGAETSIEDVLGILKREGMIDEAQAQKVLAKYAVERKESMPGWLQGLEFSGDFRGRYETFGFDEDARGIDQGSRTRFRYRARFGFTKSFGDSVRIGLRLASGEAGGDARSGNVSFGGAAGDQFSPDSIFIDRAFLEVNLTDSQALQTRLSFGKTGSPFISDRGMDLLSFDSELNMEGLFVTSTFRPDELTRIYGTVGGFILDEVAADKDPKLFAGQLGFERVLGQGIGLGLRASAYQYRSLDDPFIMSAMRFGNLSSAFDGKARFGETLAWVSLDLSETWPLLFFGTASKNFSADASVQPILMTDAMGMPQRIGTVRVSDEDLAYGVGFEVGSADKLVKIGLGYFRIEANSVLSTLNDSDVTDGFTNREGLVLSASRALTRNTQLKLTLFDAEEITDKGGVNGPFGPSLVNADRKKAQLDLLFAF